MKIQHPLAANAVFSGVSAAFIALQGAWLQAHIPMPEWLWTVAAAGLALFALQLAAMVMNTRLANMLIKQVIVSDALWLLATSIGLMLYSAELTNLGVVIVMLINGVVGTLAWWQLAAWKATRLVVNDHGV